MTAILYEELSRSRQGTWLWEDPLSRPTDEWLASYAYEVILRSPSHVYFFVNDKSTPERVAEAVKQCMPQLPPAVGILRHTQCLLMTGRFPTRRSK